MNYFYSDVAVCGVLVFLRTVLNCFICELFDLMTARSIKYLLTYLLPYLLTKCVLVLLSLSLLLILLL